MCLLFPCFRRFFELLVENIYYFHYCQSIPWTWGVSLFASFELHVSIFLWIAFFNSLKADKLSIKLFTFRCWWVLYISRLRNAFYMTAKYLMTYLLVEFGRYITIPIVDWSESWFSKNVRVVLLQYCICPIQVYFLRHTCWSVLVVIVFLLHISILCSSLKCFSDIILLLSPWTFLESFQVYEYHIKPFLHTLEELDALYFLPLLN